MQYSCENSMIYKHLKKQVIISISPGNPNTSVASTPETRQNIGPFEQTP